MHDTPLLGLRETKGWLAKCSLDLSDGAFEMILANPLLYLPPLMTNEMHSTYTSSRSAPLCHFSEPRDQLLPIRHRS